MEYLFNALLFFGTVVAMEGVAWLTHRYVMHGWGWAWHRSHHEPLSKRTGWFEWNDLYAVVGAAVSISLIAWGADDLGPSYWIGWGMAGYGLLYFLFHDGLVHRRWPLRWQPKSGYLKRLVQAHKMHHAVHEKHGCVSYGFLYARPLPDLKERLRQVREGSGDA
ncbi:MAG: sterol desaturase family protein [Wenzhouxiangellaceae bacterium]|nr:sterol desaturase family protein [Wenzhouxiangellaceae bacterium]